MATEDRSERREQGSALIVIGLGVLLADLLVVFFAPAGFRLGQRSAFVAVIVALAVVGLGLVLWGRSRRRRVV